MSLVNKNYYQRKKTYGSREQRIKRFKSLSSEERKLLIRKKLELQGLTEGSGLKKKDQSYYDKEEMTDLIILTRCFQNNKFQ